MKKRRRTRVKKAFVLWLFAIAAVLSVSACGDNSEDVSGKRDPFDGYHEEFTSPTPTPTMALQDGLEDLRTISVASTDSQWYLDEERIAEVEDAFYLIIRGWIVRYDKTSGTGSYWCNRADCEHGSGQSHFTGNLECDAYLAKMVEYEVTEEHYAKLLAYDGKLHLLAKKEDGAYLQGFSDAGEKSGEAIFVTDEKDMSDYEVTLHRGKIYYTLADGVYVRDVETGEGDCLYKVSDNGSISGIRVMEDTLYIATMSDKAEVTALGLENKSTETLVSVKQPCELKYALTEEGDIYFFAQGVGLCCYDAQTKATRTIWKEETDQVRNVTYDGRYLCVDNANVEEDRLAGDEDAAQKGWIKIFSTDGELLRTDNCYALREKGEGKPPEVYSDLRRNYGGNGAWLFTEISQQMFVLDKSADKLKWEFCDAWIGRTFTFGME